MEITNTYMVLNPKPLEVSAIWGDVVEDFSSVRLNLAGTKCIVKWQGPKPGPLPGNTEYDHAGIHAYLIANWADWVDPDAP